jgi:hypothetical protein
MTVLQLYRLCSVKLWDYLFSGKDVNGVSSELLGTIAAFNRRVRENYNKP